MGPGWEKTNSADLQVAIRNGPRFRWQLLLMGVRNDLRLAVVDSDVVVFQEHLKCHETWWVGEGTESEWDLGLANDKLQTCLNYESFRDLSTL